MGEEIREKRIDRMLSLSPRILCCVGLPISRCLSNRVMSLQSSRDIYGELILHSIPSHS